MVGIVSIGDLVNWTISAQANNINQLYSYITGKYRVKPVRTWEGPYFWAGFIL